MSVGAEQNGLAVKLRKKGNACSIWHCAVLGECRRSERSHIKGAKTFTVVLDMRRRRLTRILRPQPCILKELFPSWLETREANISRRQQRNKQSFELDRPCRLDVLDRDHAVGESLVPGPAKLQDAMGQLLTLLYAKRFTFVIPLEA